MKDWMKFISGIIIGLLVGIALCYWVAQTEATEVALYPTGYEILNAANSYRISQGLAPFILDQELCNNIAARWQNYMITNSHDGLQEFVENNMPPGRNVWEILAAGNSAEETIHKWAGSPSHNLALINNSKACSYSAEGASVMLLSN